MPRSCCSKLPAARSERSPATSGAHDLVEALDHLVSFRRRAGDDAGAADVLETLTQVLRADGADPDGTRSAQLARALERLGALAMQLGQHDRAALAFTEAVALRRAACARGTGSAIELARSLGHCGALALMRQDWDEAAAIFAEVVERLEQAETAATPLAPGACVNALEALGTAHQSAGRQAAAIAAFERGAERAGRRAEASDGTAERAQWAQLLHNLGRLYLDTDQPGRARDILARCSALTRRLAESGALPLRVLHAAALGRLGAACIRLGDDAGARLPLDESVTMMRQLVEHENRTELADELATAVQDLARLRDRGDGGTQPL